MYDHVHEKITVIAEFSTGKAKIHSFSWRDKDYRVEEVTLITKAYKGRDTVWMFHVATTSAAFKLRFDTDTLNWWVEELTWAGEQS